MVHKTTTSNPFHLQNLGLNKSTIKWKQHTTPNNGYQNSFQRFEQPSHQTKQFKQRCTYIVSQYTRVAVTRLLVHARYFDSGSGIDAARRVAVIISIRFHCAFAREPKMAIAVYARLPF